MSSRKEKEIVKHQNFNAEIVPGSYGALLDHVAEVLIATIKGVPKWGIHFLHLTYKHKFLLITLIGLGALGGFAVASFSPAKYESSLIIKSDRIDNNKLMLKINELNSLCKYGPREYLDDILGIGLERSQCLEAIEINELHPTQHSDKLEESNQDSEKNDTQKKFEDDEVGAYFASVKKNEKLYEIKVKSSASFVYDFITAPIVQYIEQGNQFVADNSQAIEALVNKKHFLYSELQKIDSMRTTYNHLIAEKSPSVFFSSENESAPVIQYNPSPLHTMYMDVFDRASSIDNEIEKINTPPLYILKGFNTSVTQLHVSRQEASMAGGALGGILTVAFILLLQLHFYFQRKTNYKA